MSLNVPSSMIEAASAGKPVELPAFIRLVHDSLHDAFHIVGDLAARLRDDPAFSCVVHAPASMDDGTRGQLLRMMASNSIRGALERHFGVALAFQNCHKVAAFRPEYVGSDAWNRFVSMEEQVLNQSPERRDC
jgi:hypothetical protein